MGVSTLIASKTIVVADDTEFVRTRFAAALADADHRVIAVNSGTDLLASVEEDPTAIDLLVLDLRLSRLKGFDLIRSLRRLHPTHPPIVVFSGTIASASEVRVLEALGVVGYVNEYTAVHHIVPALEPYLADDGPRSRRGPRVALGIPVTYRIANSIATAMTLNLSRGGLAIRTTRPLTLGTTVQLHFNLPGGADIETTAHAVWRDARVGMGLEFADLATWQQTAIDSYVQEHFFSYRMG
jgi:uncharacterized protein (TIGR02266 family)